MPSEEPDDTSVSDPDSHDNSLASADADPEPDPDESDTAPEPGSDPAEAATSSDAADTPEDGGDPLATDEKYCHNCGVPIKAAAAVCPECGARQDRPDATPGESTAAATIQEKDPLLAGILSFLIPGAGQLYNEQIGRAIALFLGVIIGDVILFVVGSVLLVVLVGVVFYLLIPVIHVLVAYDAYSQAQKINSGVVTP